MQDEPLILQSKEKEGQTSRSDQPELYFLLPSLREISSTILGRRSLRPLSTMLAIAGSDSEPADTSSGRRSAPTAAAMAATSRGEAADAEAEGGPVSRIRFQSAHAAAVVAARSDSLLPSALTSGASEGGGAEALSLAAGT